MLAVGRSYHAIIGEWLAGSVAAITTATKSGTAPSESAQKALGDLVESARVAHLQIEFELTELATRRRLTGDLGQIETLVKQAMGSADDLQYRHINTPHGLRVLVMAIDGLINDQQVNEHVLQPLITRADAIDPHYALGAELTDVQTVQEAIQALLHGRIVTCIDGGRSFAIDVRHFEHRAPNEPDLEPSIRGPREGFVEVLRVNTAAIRRRLATNLLRIEEISLGGLGKSRVAILYVVSRVDAKALATVRRRLKQATWDILSSSQEIEALLEDRRWSIFPQARHSERPDVCAAALMEGRIVIMIDGTPFAVIVPVTFWELLQAPDDYYLRWPFASLIRMLRLFALLLTMLVLPLYVAVTTFHQELIPTEFLLSLAASREALPVPTLVEALGINIGFDLLREASTRLPKQIGGALTIVGALVIGESAVRGGFVSAPMVILIGLGALSAFVLPAFSTTIPFRVLNYVLLIVGGILGLFGVVLGSLVVLCHMAGLSSLGMPYLAPMAPFRWDVQEDVLVRLPWHVQQGPPAFIGAPERTQYRGASPPAKGRA